MNCLEEVPFKIPAGSLDEPLEEVQLVSAPELNIPDDIQILQQTQYDFGLERWVLQGLQNDHLGGPCPPCETQPSCPPYWLMLSRRRSEPGSPAPRQRSHSLSAADIRCLHPRVKFIISDSEGDDGYSEDDEDSSSDGDRPLRPSCATEPRRGSSLLRLQLPGLRDFRPGSSPHLPNLPSPGLAARQRKSSLTSCSSSSSCLDPRQSPGPGLGLDRRRVGSPQCQCQGQRRPKRRLHPLGQPRPSTAGHVPTIRSHKPTLAVARPLSSHRAIPDSSAELLSALSPEEQELLEAITDQGYSLRRAIWALQKTGRQSLEQVLNYLVACDRLCKHGFEEAQVEEALEMFQNCETKAAEFLHLLAQFNEMGFQQNAIKEVLLVHGNHRETALEELMTRVE
uniref:Ubiquitin associated protein 1 like n=1 Tax=Lepisosteus oculatus TaxID=7918 RepID=W5N9T0_LEPOC